MMRQDNVKDSEVQPLVWTPSSNYGTEDNGTECSIVNEPTESMPKRQIGVVSVVFIIDRKSTRLNSSHLRRSRMPSSA